MFTKKCFILIFFFTENIKYFKCLDLLNYYYMVCHHFKMLTKENSFFSYTCSLTSYTIIHNNNIIFSIYLLKGFKNIQNAIL